MAEPEPPGQHAALQHPSPRRMGTCELWGGAPREPAWFHGLPAECPSWSLSLPTCNN